MDNLDSFDQLGFAPHVAGLSNERHMATTVMGQSVSMPVLISPPACRPFIPRAKSRSLVRRPLGAWPWA